MVILFNGVLKPNAKEEPKSRNGSDGLGLQRTKKHAGRRAQRINNSIELKGIKAIILVMVGRGGNILLGLCSRQYIRTFHP